MERFLFRALANIVWNIYFVNNISIKVKFTGLVKDISCQSCLQLIYFTVSGIYYSSIKTLTSVMKCSMYDHLSFLAGSSRGKRVLLNFLLLWIYSHRRGAIDFAGVSRKHVHRRRVKQTDLQHCTRSRLIPRACRRPSRVKVTLFAISLLADGKKFDNQLFLSPGVLLRLLHN